MIFDSEVELKLLESQPEWCGILEKVKEINNKKNSYIARFDKDPKEWIQKAIDACDQDIKFFENILLFWSTTYKKMAMVSDAVYNQSKIVNEGYRILSLIEDLKIGYTYDIKLDMVLSQACIDMAKEKGMNTDKMDKVLTDLRSTIREYRDHMFKALDSEVKNIADAK